MVDESLLVEYRNLAVKWRLATGRSMTSAVGDMGEFEAARLLGLKRAAVNCRAFDAIDSSGRRYQIKTRAGRGRYGDFKLPLEGFEFALFVRLGEDFQPIEIWRASIGQVDEMIAIQHGRAGISDTVIRRHCELSWASFAYPKPDARRSGSKVGWFYYRDVKMAEKARRVAKLEAAELAKQGYDFGYCAPGFRVEHQATGEFAGMYEVCVP